MVGKILNILEAWFARIGKPHNMLWNHIGWKHFENTWSLEIIVFGFILFRLSILIKVEKLTFAHQPLHGRLKMALWWRTGSYKWPEMESIHILLDAKIWTILHQYCTSQHCTSALQHCSTAPALQHCTSLTIVIQSSASPSLRVGKYKVAFNVIM